jgi:hypothetical protein
MDDSSDKFTKFKVIVLRFRANLEKMNGVWRANQIITFYKEDN